MGIFSHKGDIFSDWLQYQLYHRYTFMYIIVLSTLLTNLNTFKQQFNYLYYYIHTKQALYTLEPP